MARIITTRYDSTVTYGGEEMTLGGVLSYLQGLGQPYSLDS